MRTVDTAILEVLDHTLENFCSYPDHVIEILKRHGVHLVVEPSYGKDSPTAQKANTRELNVSQRGGHPVA